MEEPGAPPRDAAACRPWLAACLGACLAACGGGTGDGGAIDSGADVARDGAPAVEPSLDFSAAGCAPLAVVEGAGQPARLECRGVVPLTLRFFAVTAGLPEGAEFIWQFSSADGEAPGDIIDDSSPPAVTFERPGRYDVKLSALGLVRERAAFVVATTSRLGEPCDEDRHCDDGLACLCGGNTCGTAFPRGICHARCAVLACGGGASCVDLTRGYTPSATAVAWRDKLCLRPCDSDQECSPDTRCRTLPGGAGGWVAACFPDLLREAGASCRDPGGVLRDERCATGRCEDLGALGVCTADCGAGTCPPTTECVRMNGGARLCLKACADHAACGSDPLIDCVPPGDGPLGFTPEVVIPGRRYCAPKTCGAASDCAPAGVCRVGGGGGQCALAP